jgi:hypothetical protein
MRLTDLLGCALQQNDTLALDPAEFAMIDLFADLFGIGQERRGDQHFAGPSHTAGKRSFKLASVETHDLLPRPFIRRNC